MDCSFPSSSVHGSLQARLLEWIAMPSLRRSFPPRNQTCISALQVDSLWLSHWGSPICTVPNVKCQVGWITNWNQDCWDKYQQPRICRYHSNGRKWRGTKELLMKVKEESEKAGLKLNIHKTKIMVSSPITSCQWGGGKMEIVTDYIFLGSKITVDSDCSHEIKRRLLLGRKFKSRHISFCR